MHKQTVTERIKELEKNFYHDGLPRSVYIGGCEYVPLAIEHAARMAEMLEKSDELMGYFHAFLNFTGKESETYLQWKKDFEAFQNQKGSGE